MRALIAGVVAALSGCSAPATEPERPIDLGPPPVTRQDPQAGRVLVVVNSASAIGVAISKYYRAARGIPAENVVVVTTTLDDDVSAADFATQIQAPVAAKLKTLHGVDFIVTTHGIPLRAGDYATDMLLAGIELDLAPIQAFTSAEFKRATSPYFRMDEPFSHAKFGLYLTTRLDGYSIEDMKALVDRSLAAKPEKGLFFLDQQVFDRVAINDQLETAMEQIARTLTSRGFESVSEGTPAFVDPKQPLMGYWSSGSNDPNYSATVYHALRFKAGALAETNVSTSARTFHHVSGGQSMIADLIAQGATGAKGYVAEPYTTAVAKPDIMFDRYTRGYNLAESFYMASQLLKWRDVVLGDPLCRPYAPAGVMLRERYSARKRARKRWVLSAAALPEIERARQVAHRGMASRR
ncbi:MAG: TIGR03790 family protein [bacterium]